MMKGWGVHGCGWLSRDPTCRENGTPRIHFNTPWGSLIVGLTWGARTQLWLPWKTRVPWADRINAQCRTKGLPEPLPDGKSNYSRWRSPVTWSPR